MPETPEPTSDYTRYPSHPRQIGIARRHSALVLTGWGADQDTIDTAFLAVSELTTNAVIHARNPHGRQFALTLRLLDDAVRIEVHDANTTHPQSASATPDATDMTCGGRGLLLIDQLSKGCWGSAAEIVGKTVWVEIPFTRVAAQACIPS